MSIHVAEEFVSSDQYTNIGLVISPLIESTYLEGTSVKLNVYCPDKEVPVSFTSNGTSHIPITSLTFFICLEQL